MPSDRKNILQLLPSVDSIIKALEDKNIVATAGIKRIIRDELADLRESVKNDAVSSTDDETTFLEYVITGVVEALAPSFKRAINATGIILHTNLGRAVLSKQARREIAEIASYYCNLEMDLVSGERDSRQLRVNKLLCALSGAEDALVVNNNAAAVLLVLDTLAKGREVIVSRGELVEIGGSFRVPEIMRKSGAVLHEVGTTNRTKPSDYRKGINEMTGLIMKVHPSNFYMTGFTEDVDIKELTDLCKETDNLLFYDLGSASFWSKQKEPGIEKLLEMGVDLISFSGDKLLGGPQAGIILGKKNLISQLNANNLHRALRIDKLSLCALEVTLRHYLLGEEEQIPTYGMAGLTAEEMTGRSKDFAAAIASRIGPSFTVSVESGLALWGGGSLPEESISGPIIVIDGDHKNIIEGHKLLRGQDPAVITTLKHGRLEINLRTVSPEEELPLLQKIVGVFKQENFSGR